MTDDIAATRKQRGEQATAQQRRAADPARSVWVEASAGTGKTKVLSDRVLAAASERCAAGKNSLSDLYQGSGGGNEFAHCRPVEPLGGCRR